MRDIRVNKEKIKSTSTPELWAIFQIIDKAYPITMLGDNGIVIHNAKAVIWKELKDRAEFLLK